MTKLFEQAYISEGIPIDKETKAVIEQSAEILSDMILQLVFAEDGASEASGLFESILGDYKTTTEFYEQLIDGMSKEELIELQSQLSETNMDDPDEIKKANQAIANKLKNL